MPLLQEEQKKQILFASTLSTKNKPMSNRKKRKADDFIKQLKASFQVENTEFSLLLATVIIKNTLNLWKCLILLRQPNAIKLDKNRIDPDLQC